MNDYIFSHFAICVTVTNLVGYVHFTEDAEVIVFFLQLIRIE